MTTATERVTIESVDPHCRVAERLIADLSEELEAGTQNQREGVFSPDNSGEPRSVFLVARFGDGPIGCGALLPMSGDVGEIKCMFVARAARRLGIGSRIIDAIERFAADFHYQRLRLETGVLQEAAIALYEHAGYHRIANCECEENNPRSVCYEKEFVRA